jgi:hypothetical protein
METKYSKLEKVEMVGGKFDGLTLDIKYGQSMIIDTSNPDLIYTRLSLTSNKFYWVGLNLQNFKF